MDRLQTKLERIGRDPKITAKAVGLRYAACTEKGFYRKRRGKNFYYTNETGDRINDNEILERIRKLVIPPAWEAVWISPHENGHLQVTGTDTKGRRQYRYHPQWNAIRNQSKFYRLRRFAEALPLIRLQVERDLARPGLPYEKVVALVVKLIELTHIRIGNDAYKKLYGSFGLTTLQDKHVKIATGGISFEFVGKKGVKHQVALKSRKLATLVKKCRDIPGQDLFQYYDDAGQHHTIGSADVNQYLKSATDEDFTAKDFRVWAGSVHALCAFREAGEPANDSDCRHKIVAVLDSVSKKLGNTRTVCKKYYVHPTVVAAYERGTLWQYQADAADDNLDEPERALVSLLENEALPAVVA